MEALSAPRSPARRKPDLPRNFRAPVPFRARSVPDAKPETARPEDGATPGPPRWVAAGRPPKRPPRSPSCCAWRRCAGSRGCVSLVALDGAAIFGAISPPSGPERSLRGQRPGRRVQLALQARRTRTRSRFALAAHGRCSSRARTSTPAGAPAGALAHRPRRCSRSRSSRSSTRVEGQHFSSYYIFYGACSSRSLYVSGPALGASSGSRGVLLRKAGYRRRAVLVGSAAHIEAVAHALAEARSAVEPVGYVSLAPRPRTGCATSARWPT